MRKKMTKTDRVLAYIKTNPTAKAVDIAKALGVHINTVYQVVYLAKKRTSSLPMTALTPSTTAPNAQMSLNLFSDPPKRGKQTKIVLTHKKPDNVNHPAHYKTGGIETIDFIEAKKLGYNLGNVVKYISRADHKGARLENLEKAQWYLNREIANERKNK
jgi:hypothetical protein